MDDVELHAKAPERESPPPAPAEEDPKRKAMLERLALARAAKKNKKPEPDEGGTQLPVERQKLSGKYKPRRQGKKTLYRLTTEAQDRKAAKKKKLEPSEIAGITPTGCPVACSPECCVITGENVCGHPAKGGLQPKYLGVTAAMSRFNQARLELARLMAEQQKTKAL